MSLRSGSSILEAPRGATATGPRQRPGVGPRRVLVPLLATSLLASCGYGRIHELDERVLEARSDIEIQLLRRAELVPTLMETVQRYVEVEPTVIEAVAGSRVGLVAAVRSAEMSAVESASASLAGALHELLGAVAWDVHLRTDPGYQRLMAQLEDTEEQIVRAASSYNEAVKVYNEFVARFPQAVTARLIGADSHQPYGPQAAADSASPADE
jgi:LemA protein